MNYVVRPPKLARRPKLANLAGQWGGYANEIWQRKDKSDVTILYNVIERRKSLFLRAYFERYGFKYEDLGDHVRDDVSYGKEYGNRMECNPMYFTSGALIRNLLRIERETGLSKEEIAKKYIFLGGGGQCGPCRYGMYPQEYLKVVNEAGFKGFRILIFASDIGAAPLPRESAFHLNLPFMFSILDAILLADLLHGAECALRPYAVSSDEVDDALGRAEEILLAALRKPLHRFHVVRATAEVGDLFARVERIDKKLPLIFVTGEFFANLAHNDGNYHLRRFIMDEGCEVIPGFFAQRVLYDNWRRTCEAKRNIKYANSLLEQLMARRTLARQAISSALTRHYWALLVKALKPERFGCRTELLDFEELARLGRDYYNPEIFGGEGHLEVAEAVHYANTVDGFISCKPFGCMPSSGVSDGVQAKIVSMHPSLDFLSIETSGDNEVSILSRVSMLLFKAKQKVHGRDSRALH